MPGLPDEELFELAERSRPRRASTRARCGRRRARRRRRARTPSWHEARFALEARELAEAADRDRDGNGASPPAAGELATYRDLGSFQLLLSLQDTDALRLYCDSLLGPIENGEGHYGGELMRSLEAFIECNGQWEAAARRLYCHRHTLRYRIRKIEELTGRDLARRATGSSSGSHCAAARSSRASPAGRASASMGGGGERGGGRGEGGGGGGGGGGRGGGRREEKGRGRGGEGGEKGGGEVGRRGGGRGGEDPGLGGGGGRGEEG